MVESRIEEVADCARQVSAVHFQRPINPDPDHEMALARHLVESLSREERLGLLDRFTGGAGEFDQMMRRILWRGLARWMGNGAQIGRWISIHHLDTIELGDGVFIGDHAVLQGRHDGHCRIGNRVWIGPQSFLDARDLEIGDAVGWGPGAKVIGSTHTGYPEILPVIATDLEIRPVRIGAGADVGAGATVLPGVTIGAGSIIGAGAVVTGDIPPSVIAAGVPARILRDRKS